MTARRAFWFGLAAAVWVVPLLRGALSASFWLDECISLWITSGDAARVIDLTLAFQGQSPLYYLVLRGWEEVAGQSEIGVRLLSYLALGVSAALLFEMVSRRLSPAAGALAACLFLGMDVVQQAWSARPYGLAILCSMVALRALSVETRSFPLFFAGAVAAFYFHYTFGVLFLLPWILPALDREFRAKLRLLAFVSLGQGLLAIPGILHLRSLLLRQAEIEFLPPLSLIAVLKVIFPLPQLIIIVFSVLVTAVMFWGRGLLRSQPARGGSSRLWIVVWLFPPLFFALAEISGISVFSARYFGWYVIGFAAVAAYLAAERVGKQALTVLALLICGFTFYREWERQWITEDWREAAALVRAGRDEGTVPKVFIYSGLAEAEASGSALSEFEREYLTVPFQIYPTGRPLQPVAGSVGAIADTSAMFSQGAPGDILVYLNRKFPKAGGRSEENLFRAITLAGFEAVAHPEMQGPVRVARLEKANSP